MPMHSLRLKLLLMPAIALGFSLPGCLLGSKAVLPRHTAGNLKMLENPLAKIFGGGDKPKEPKGGALSQGFDTLLKDAPLPVKLAAGLMKPLVGALESAIEQSQEDADALLAEAQGALRADQRVTALLGTDVTIGSVFSTASSSSSINGKVQKSVNLQCQCAGSMGTGVVAISGRSDDKGNVSVDQLQVQAGGQVFAVQTLRGGPGGGAGASGSNGIIDVDVI
jgi:hypothetical protein